MLQYLTAQTIIAFLGGVFMAVLVWVLNFFRERRLEAIREKNYIARQKEDHRHAMELAEVAHRSAQADVFRTRLIEYCRVLERWTPRERLYTSNEMANHYIPESVKFSSKGAPQSSSAPWTRDAAIEDCLSELAVLSPDDESSDAVIAIRNLLRNYRRAAFLADYCCTREDPPSEEPPRAFTRTYAGVFADAARDEFRRIAVISDWLIYAWGRPSEVPEGKLSQGKPDFATEPLLANIDVHRGFEYAIPFRTMSKRNQG